MRVKLDSDAASAGRKGGFIMRKRRLVSPRRRRAPVVAAPARHAVFTAADR